MTGRIRSVLEAGLFFFLGHRRLLVFFTCGVLTLQASLVSALEPTIKIGVLAKRGTERCLAQWSPTADYLTEALPGKTFEIVPLDFKDVTQVVEQGAVDFILTNSALYVELEIKYGASRIATLKNKILNDTSTTFGGVIFCLKRRTDIKTLHDLEHKRFMAVDKTSFGGWLMAWRELKEAGVDPFSDFSSLTFGGTHDAVVYAVRDGKVDAGTVRTDTLERMQAEGRITLDEFHVIHEHGGGTVHLPFLHSTRAYPEWPMAKVAHTSLLLAEAVAVKLIEMPEDSKAAVAAVCSGWTIPLNYQSVHDCIQFLGIGPYEDLGGITFREVAARYWLELLLALCLFVVMTLSIGFFIRLNWNIRRQQAQLQKSEEKHRLLIEHSISGIAVHEIVLDKAGRPVDYVFLDVNLAFEKHTGLHAADVLGRRATDVLPGMEESPFISIYGKVALTGEPVSFEQFMPSLGRHYAVNAYGVGEGRFATVFTDITEKKRVAEEIRNNESRLRRLVEILQHPSRTTQEFLDHALEQAIALTESRIGYIYHYHEGLKEFVLNSWSKEVMAECAVINPQTRYALDKTGIWGEVVRQRKPIFINDYGADHPLKKGYPQGHVELRKFMTIPIFKGGDIVGVVGLANKEADYDHTDLLQVSLLMESVWKVVDRKQTEETLRETEARLRCITDSAHEAIIMMDPKGAVSFWNPAAEEILGHRTEEALGRNLHHLLAPGRYHEDHRAAYPEFLRSGHGNAVGKTVELMALRKDGQEIVVALSLSGVLLNDAWHAVGILRDITEQKLTEEELKKTNRELEAAIIRANDMTAQAEIANMAKSEFLANMSHEIRTPMNGVIGMTGLLLDTKLTDEQHRYAEIVRTSGESLLALINDILDFSKIEANKLDLEILDFDLQSLLEDFSTSLALKAHEKGLEMVCGMALDVPRYLSGDPGRLRQILTNLVGNAVKFTLSGEVAIRVARVSETEDTVLLRFSVRDTGIGIPEEKVGILFDKFTQVDASTTRRFGGTGLGLAISKQLTELMGGDIGVDSKEGSGSAFWFTARLMKQHNGAAAEIPPPADLESIRVLIVDDNATNRELLSVRLASWGMRVSEVPDGPAALHALRKAMEDGDPFRIAAIDMQMPGMDGEELGHAIQAESRLSDIRMVMMTSLGSRGDARQFAGIGFAAYLNKPLRHQELKDVLSLVLTKGDCTKLVQTPIVTRHTVREATHTVAGSRARILLAEDNVTNQQVALGILKKLGLAADAVANGAEAIAALKTIPYDLVLMDVQMPEIDGHEATRRIRDARTGVLNPRIPIIAMTAHAMQGAREKCLAAGMNSYVSKPVSSRELSEVLEEWLPLKSDDSPITGGEPEGMVVKGKETAEPVVWDRQGMFDRLMGDEDFAGKIVKGFLGDIPCQLQALDKFLQGGDVKGLERQAHTIMGAAANMGGEALRAEAFTMQNAARNGDLVAAGEIFQRFEEEFERLKQEMGMYLNENK